MEENCIKLHPVLIHRNNMAALFGKDDNVTVTVEYGEGNGTHAVFDVIVGEYGCKANAMRRLLKGQFTIDDVTCTLNVNGVPKFHDDIVAPDAIVEAFTGNSVFRGIRIEYNADGTIDKLIMLWDNKTILYPNQLNSISGMMCHSAEDLARSVLSGKVNCVLMHSTKYDQRIVVE